MRVDLRLCLGATAAASTAASTVWVRTAPFGLPRSPWIPTLGIATSNRAFGRASGATTPRPTASPSAASRTDAFRHCEPKGLQVFWREAISSLHVLVGVRCSEGIASPDCYQARNDAMGLFARNDAPFRHCEGAARSNLLVASCSSFYKKIQIFYIQLIY